MSHRLQACIRAHLGWGAQRPETEHGPESLESSPHHAAWAAHIDVWRDVWPKRSATQHRDLPPEERWPDVRCCVERLAEVAFEVVQQGAMPLFVGGDHAMAAGTWRGVARALKEPMGLVWFDAHMDAHTPKSSPSQAMHGMPVAALLGHGASAWGEALTQPPVVHPEHLVLVGVRSYEPEEEAFLKQQGVAIYFMEEVLDRGLAVIYREVVAALSQKVGCWGMSVDLDFFDPNQVPGVGSPEPHGADVAAFLKTLAQDTPWEHVVGFEIVEYNPQRDQEHQTRTVVEQLIQCWLARSGR